jgi:hypothetical protein
MIWFIGDSITVTLNYNHLWQLTACDCLRHVPFLPGPRAPSLPLWLSSTNDVCRSQSQSYVTRIGQSVLGPRTHLGLKTTRFIFLLVAGLLMWGALSDERMGLSFTIAAGPRQRSHSPVRITRDSWPYFTVSDSRFPQPGGPTPCIYIPQKQGGPIIPPGIWVPFSSPRTTHRTTVEVFDPASTVADWTTECTPFYNLARTGNKTPPLNGSSVVQRVSVVKGIRVHRTVAQQWAIPLCC